MKYIVIEEKYEKLLASKIEGKIAWRASDLTPPKIAIFYDPEILKILEDKGIPYELL